MRRIDHSRSRLERFLQRHRITPTALSLQTGYTLKHLVNLRKGDSRPTLESATRIAHACEQLLGKPVQLGELFTVVPRRKVS